MAVVALDEEAAAAMSGRNKRPCDLAVGASLPLQIQVVPRDAVEAHLQREDAFQPGAHILAEQRTMAVSAVHALVSVEGTQETKEPHFARAPKEARKTIVASASLARAMAAGTQAQRTLVNPRNSR